MRVIKGIGEMFGFLLTAYFAVNIACFFLWLLYHAIYHGVLMFADFLQWVQIVLS